MVEDIAQNATFLSSTFLSSTSILQLTSLRPKHLHETLCPCGEPEPGSKAIHDSQRRLFPVVLLSQPTSAPKARLPCIPVVQGLQQACEMRKSSTHDKYVHYLVARSPDVEHLWIPALRYARRVNRSTRKVKYPKSEEIG